MKNHLQNIRARILTQFWIMVHVARVYVKRNAPVVELNLQFQLEYKNQDTQFKNIHEDELRWKTADNWKNY